MLTRRLIPCLDVRDGRVVKGVRFRDLRDSGSPVDLAARYEADGADEIVVLDISATLEARAHALTTVRAVRTAVSIPITAGGGVRTEADARALLDAGADKVALNTAAQRDPGVITDLAMRFGSQCVTVSVDAEAHEGAWRVVVRAGTAPTTLSVTDWVRKAACCGAGEILLTSVDRDGTQAGYDTDLIRAVSERVNVPVIASGGARTSADMVRALDAGADAVLAASILHDGVTSVRSLKEALLRANVSVRP